MKVTIKKKLGNSEVSFDAEIQGLKGFFKFNSQISQLPSSCGNCQGTDVNPVHRAVKSNGKSYDYYEVECGSCGHRLGFGQYQDGSGLFARYFDKNNNPIAHNGWTPPYKKGDSQNNNSNSNDYSADEDVPF